MTPDQARERFAAARVARLATVSARGAPRLVPVTFALAGPGLAGPGGAVPEPPVWELDGTELAGPGMPAADRIVTAVDHKPKTTSRLRRLEDIAHEPRVTLLVDEYDDDWARLWWARADGTARVAEPGDPGHAAAVRALADRYEQYRQRLPAGPAIIVTVVRWSGWSAAGW